MSKYNIPVFICNDKIIENRLSKDSSTRIIIPDNELLKECIIYFFDELTKENNETRLKQLEKELNYFINHRNLSQITLDFSIKETRTIEEVPFDKPSEYNFEKGKKKENIKDDNFFEMFGFNDEVAIKEKEQQLKNEEKLKKQPKEKKSKVIEEIKSKPEVIQEELNEKDIEYCNHLKERFIFIDYHFERLYHSVYLIALFQEKNGNRLVLIKFNNNYLLTNEWYLEEYKGEKRI